MPVTTTLKSKNIINFNVSDDVIIIAVPLIAGLVDPANIMTAVGRPSFMGDHCNQLIVSRVQSDTVRPVQYFVGLLVLFFLLVDL